MPERRAKLRLGVFVVGSIAALTGLAILFGGTPQVFRYRTKYTLLFPEAPGINPGTPVRKSGVRIGDVSSIDLDEATGQVRVSIQVDKKFLPRRGEEPAVTRGILSGDTTIDFIPKAKPELVANRNEPYEPDSEIPGVPPINARQLLNQASGVLPNAQESLVQIMSSFRRLEQIAPKVEATLDEFQGLARSSREAIPELRRTNEKVQELLGAGGPDDNPPNMKALIQDIRDFLKAVRPVADDLRTVMKDNKDEITQTLKAVRTLSERASDVLNDDNRKSITGTLKNVRDSSDDLAKTIKLFGIVLSQADESFKLINARLAQAEKVIGNIEKATVPFAENAGDILKNVNAATLQLAQAMNEIRDTIRLFARNDGTLQQALRDPALYQNLNEAAAALTRTLIRAERVAKDLEVFADKVARRPETIGIGGAIRPSTGLKESPQAPSRGPIFPSVPVGGPNLAPGPLAPNPLQPVPSLPPPPEVRSEKPPKLKLPPPIFPENN